MSESLNPQRGAIALPAACTHRSREQWKRDAATSWCFDCWRASKKAEWDAIERRLAAHLHTGKCVLETMPNTKIRWWIAEGAAMAQHFWGGEWREPHQAFMKDITPYALAEHLRNRGEGFEFQLSLED